MRARVSFIEVLVLTVQIARVDDNPRHQAIRSLYTLNIGGFFLVRGSCTPNDSKRMGFALRAKLPFKASDLHKLCDVLNISYVACSTYQST